MQESRDLTVDLYVRRPFVVGPAFPSTDYTPDRRTVQDRPRKIRYREPCRAIHLDRNHPCLCSGEPALPLPCTRDRHPHSRALHASCQEAQVSTITRGLSKHVRRGYHAVGGIQLSPFSKTISTAKLSLSRTTGVSIHCTGVRSKLVASRGRRDSCTRTRHASHFRWLSRDRRPRKEVAVRVITDSQSRRLPLSAPCTIES